VRGIGHRDPDKRAVCESRNLFVDSIVGESRVFGKGRSQNLLVRSSFFEIWQGKLARPVIFQHLARKESFL